MIVVLLSGFVLADPPANPQQDLFSKTGFKAAYQSVSTRSQFRNKPNPAELVPELILLYRVADHVRGVSNRHKNRYKSGLEYNLKKMKTKLEGDMKRKKLTYLNPKKAKDVLGGGASVASQAAGLIRLIQQTIEPDSWDVNGGEGTISFWPYPHALVIRAAP